MRSMLTILCLFASSAHAVPGQFTHQGRLLADDGTPMTGEATITFRVINEETGGDTLWSETQTVPLTNGFYAAVLGADETENPLDTDVLQQAPVWLELQLDGEPAMFPRSPVHAVPYATISTVAGSVSGGSVNATEIAVDGTPVVDGSGNWVGPAPTIQWDDIEGMPEDFEDGTDDESDSFDALAVSCEAGDIPVLDAGSGMWVCGWDNDSLADIACTEGQLIKWSDDALGFVCAEDADTVLTAEQVDDIVADNGYAMAADVFSGSYDDLADKPSLFSGSFEDLSDVPGWLSDGDDNDQLSEAEVDAMVADNGYAMAADVFSGSFADLADTPAIFTGSFADLTGVPEDLADGDDNTQLSEDEVDAMVADNGYASDASLTDAVSDILAELDVLKAQVETLEASSTSADTPLYRLAKGCLSGPGWNHPYNSGDTLTLESSCVTLALRYHTNYWDCNGTSTSASPSTCANELVGHIVLAAP